MFEEDLEVAGRVLGFYPGNADWRLELGRALVERALIHRLLQDVEATVLDLGMALGEGSGAALALGVLRGVQDTKVPMVMAAVTKTMKAPIQAKRGPMILRKVFTGPLRVFRPIPNSSRIRGIDAVMKFIL